MPSGSLSIGEAPLKHVWKPVFLRDSRETKLINAGKYIYYLPMLAEHLCRPFWAVERGSQRRLRQSPFPAQSIEKLLRCTTVMLKDLHVIWVASSRIAFFLWVQQRNLLLQKTPLCCFIGQSQGSPTPSKTLFLLVVIDLDSELS